MNKKFDRFMKNTALVSLGIITVSALLFFSYMDSKDLSVYELFDDASMQFGDRSSGFLNNVNELSIKVKPSTSQYDTKTLTQNDVFETVDNIEIHSTIEDILFIHQERENIEINFEREIPDTSAYVVTYKARSNNNQITIDVEQRTNGLYTDRDYVGLITVYLPEDYQGDQLTIRSNVADHDMSLPKDVNDVDISVNFGVIDMTIDQPLDSLSLSINAGDLNFIANEPISKINVSVDTGELSFDINDTVDRLSVENNVGAIKGYQKISPTSMDVTCNLGDVSLIFDKNINNLSAEMNLGDLTIDALDRDDSKIYIDKDLVDFESILRRTNKRSEANVWVTMNIGSVVIK